MKKRERLSGSLTIRLSAPLERKLVRRAQARGESPSAHVRALIEADVGEGPDESSPTALELLGDLVGSVSSTKVPAGRDAKAAIHRYVRDRRG